MSSQVHSIGQEAKEHLSLPEANAEAISFLSSLEKEELQKLFFSETLAMVSDAGEPQGELTIEVQRGKYKDEFGVLTRCILVHAFSRGLLDKTLCGNSLLGYFSERLVLMEQHSQEFIKFLILPMERKMSLLKQDDQLAMTRSVKEGEQALGYQTIQVGRQQAEVLIVEQTVHSREGIPMSCQFYLLSDGHLAKRVQVGVPGCCIITKMPILREEAEIEPRPVFEKKPLVWEEDMELYSRFLHRKEELRLSHASYLRQHPEAHALISDFLLFLLLRQPQDAITFAAEHFGPFAAHLPPTPALRSSHRPSPFRTLDPEDRSDSEES
ncbi:ciliogenesis-associated TTC17-interacting protein isoform X3 [Tupaia chinensis]|uniref:ciliogenesis-associated TTC17-interacting protein isoform X3 n=1 Tax=Tupaia chinensis TaxID=246437 RepID=UPI0003C8FAA4|nr:ciliogenesis-associated TTC17-interacting protein isoform X3 [Tupaia chinensis]